MSTLHAPTVGDYLKPDGWPPCGGELLQAGDSAVGGFKGCGFRVPAGGGLYRLAVNVTITGRRRWVTLFGWRIRCRVEFVGDGSPSQFAGAWLSYNAS